MTQGVSKPLGVKVKKKKSEGNVLKMIYDFSGKNIVHQQLYKVLETLVFGMCNNLFSILTPY
jgi:hypothetical protein